MTVKKRTPVFGESAKAVIIDPDSQSAAAVQRAAEAEPARQAAWAVQEPDRSCWGSGSVLESAAGTEAEPEQDAQPCRYHTSASSGRKNSHPAGYRSTGTDRMPESC